MGKMNRLEQDMTQTAKRETGTATSREAVRMYPDNELKQQVREFGTNLSAFDVMKEAFSEKN